MVDRVVVWFSCGITSAVAGRLAIEKYGGVFPIEVAYADTGGEHEDNARFLRDCSRWFRHPIQVLKSPKYDSIWDVFERERYLVGVAGARCTTEMKKKVRQSFERLESDIQIFGFDSSETKRAERFRQNNPEVTVEFPLIDSGLTKADCLAMVADAGIELPAMYRLGYRNNNCIGCVKGQAGYWNKIRVDFPEVFDRMARMERRIGAAINKSYAGDGKRKRVFLDELPPDAGRYEPLPDMSCGLLCGSDE